MFGRPLQGANSTSNWHYGLVDLLRPSLWMAETENIGHGKVTRAARFIDNLIEPVSTLTTATGDVHYVVSATGFIERIRFGAEGGTRESLGRARVPVGHTLRGAVELGDGFMALATHETSTEKHFLWVAKTPEATLALGSSGVSVDNWGFDARVCWSATDEELDTSGWSLGGVPALATLPLATNCALVLRDLEARPMPKETFSVLAPPGWHVVEGPVPGVGLVRGLSNVTSALGPEVPTLVKFSNIGGAMVSAWKQGGGLCSD